jgi:hypothetical protein
VTWTTVLLGALVVAILVARAVWILRAEARQEHGGRPRGVAPGKGYMEIESDYSTGVGGGNQLTTRVPLDPQEYARAFVPKRGPKQRR